MKKKYLKTCISVLAVTAVLLSACGGPQQKNVGKTTMETAKLADSIRKKYNEKYEYADPIRGVARDERLKLKMGFDIMNAGFTEYTQIVNVYKDPELTYQIGSHFEWDEKTKELSVTPPRWSVGGIMSEGLDEDAPGYQAADSSLFDKGELNDWGNLPQYYMVQYVDLETGEKLEKPIVTVFTVDSEVKNAPRVTLGINEEGFPVFRWKKVPGAERYYVMSMTSSEKMGLSGDGWVEGETEGTEWIPESTAKFITYNVSEADRREPYVIEKYGEGNEAIPKDTEYETYYCVIAVSKDGTSALSNMFRETDIARKVPFTEEVKMSLNEEGSNYTQSFGEMPSYKWVTMCDGTLVQKLINYDFESAKEEKASWSGENIVKVPYKIDGTGFDGVVVVESYNTDTWKEELEKVRIRQEKLRNRAGAVTPEMKVEGETESEKEEKESSGESERKYEVTANSALSEYLAVNMLNANTSISLKEFPESADTDYLLDAWEEAVYQNPMVLGVTGASIANGGKTLHVKYDTKSEEIKKKQKEISKEAERVVDSIITDDMTELEKEMAINQYLCDTAEYDMDALENAEENDFAGVDAKFNDSFTPYGVLLNKTGVCSSYAGAFKLLAQQAGLECIVVTGNLDGELPHAWNKIKIDGEWRIVDSTNNDNELILNALLNLPDYAADKVLVEDERFVLDDKVKDYEAKSDDKEFYRIEGKFYEKNKIFEPLKNELKEEDYDSVATRRSTRAGEPVIRSFLSRQFYRFINKISKTEIVDGARDYRLMNRKMADAVLQMSEYNRFSKGIFGWVGFKTKWLDFENVERSAGETKWSVWKLFRYSLEGITGFSVVPLALASVLGILFCGLSALVILVIIIRTLVWGDPVSGWPSMACIVFMVSGVQLLCLGILGQYLSKTYLETKHRPIYLLRESSEEGETYADHKR